MSRMTDLVTRLENVARKLGVELEECLAILEGKHPTLFVFDRPVNPTQAAPVVAADPTPEPTISSTAAPVDGTTSNPDPTSSGPAAASAETVGQQIADSTVAAGANNED